MQIDFQKLVEDTLVDTYVSVRGETPEGSFHPNDTVIAQLKQSFGNDYRDLCCFLRDSMLAHLSRTEITKTPFFINTILLAVSSLEYLEKHRTYLRSYYGATINAPRQFEQSVYGDVMQSEIDYLDYFGNYYIRTGKMASPRLLLPSVWWMIWACEFKRFNRNDFPDNWLQQRVSRNGGKKVAETLYSMEHAKLKRDTKRREVAREAAEAAINSATMQWASRHRAVRLLYEENQPRAAADSLVAPEVLEFSIPLLARDERMFAAIQAISTKKEHKTVDIVRPSYRPGLRLVALAHSADNAEDC